MNAQKALKISGIGVIILGMIHCIASPIVIPMWKSLPKAEWITCSYMFMCTGLAVIFIGWLQFFICKQEFVDAKSRRILMASIWFVFIIGAGAASFMWTNPFADITLLIALFEFFC
jgi:hypothetical protein